MQPHIPAKTRAVAALVDDQSPAHTPLGLRRVLEQTARANA